MPRSDNPKAWDYAKQQEWKRANPERVRASNRAYAMRKCELDPERMALTQRAHYWNNRTSRLAANREWRLTRGPESRAAARKVALQNATAASAMRSHARWSAAEDLAVLDDSPLAEIAFRLGRSRSAVEQRRRHLRKKGANR